LFFFLAFVKFIFHYFQQKYKSQNIGKSFV